MRAVLLAFLLALPGFALSACEARAPARETVTPVAGGDKPAETDSEAIPCKTDADCPMPSCGPCEAGKVITKRAAHLECFRNPCKNPAAVCNQDHVCAVSPKTTPDDPKQGVKE